VTLSNRSLAGKNLSGRDLRGTDLSARVLFGTDLRGCQLKGVKVSVDCRTFDGVKLDDIQVAMLLKLFAQADIAPEWIAGIHELVERVTSHDRAKAIDRLLKVT
jgi:hypothetical protein